MPAVLQHRYAPRGGCKELFSRRDDEILLSGPAGTGKSRACLEKLHLMALLTPKMKGLICRKVAATLGGTALDTWRKFVIAEALKTGGVRYYGGSQEEPAQYIYSNGSRVLIGGLDNPIKIMSAEFDVIYVQEATELTEKDWDFLSSRLRNWRISFQQLMADCNPDVPTHWLKVRCDRGDATMLESRHTDNPKLYTEKGALTVEGRAYLQRLKKLTGVRRLRLLDGLWVAAEGMIYEDFDPAIHLIDKFEIPDSWERIWVVDFGYTNPFVCQFWAVDPDGRLILYREIYHTKRTVDVHAQKIIECVSEPDPNYVHPVGEERRAHHGRIWTEPRPRMIICDHDAGGRAILERELGTGTRAANKTVDLGIQKTEARFRLRDDGTPGIRFMRNAVVERDPELELAFKPCCTVEEIPGYVWDNVPGKPPKETPVKENDHGCDCIRYLVAEKDLRGQARVRFI